MTFRRNLGILIVIFLPVISCTKEDWNTIGQEHFTCYINGEYWEVSSGIQCYDISTFYYPDGYEDVLEPGYLVLRGKDCSTLNSVFFILKGVNYARSYDLAADTNVVNCGYSDYSYLDLDEINFTTIIQGTLKFSTFQPPVTTTTLQQDGTSKSQYTPGWIEGTFNNLILANKAGDTTIITNGQFATKL